MPHKKNTPQQNTPQGEEKETAIPLKKNKDSSPTTSPRKTVNLFMVILLLIIVGGIYLYQKGYVTKYYPLVKTKLSSQSPLDATVDIPQDTSLGFPEKLVETESKATVSKENETETTTPAPQDIPSPDSMADKTLATLQERIEALEEKVLKLSNSVQHSQNKTSPTGKFITNNALISALSNLQDLQNRLNQGLSFSRELINIKALLTPEDYAILESYASLGVPNLPYLIKNFKDIERLLKQEVAFKKSTTFFEKCLAVLGQLIHIEKITTNNQDTHNLTVISSYKMRLKNGDTENLISEIEALSNNDETLTLWLSHAKAYNAVQKIIRKTKKSLFQPNL